jgi:ribosomal protein S18 acetylase RimI-like enzyme
MLKTEFVIEIRRATEADAEILAELGKTTFNQTFAKDNRKEDMDAYIAATFGPEKQLAEIRDPKRYIEIAWVGEQAVGFLHLVASEPDASVEGPEPLELLRVYADVHWHGKGVGTALMERSLEIARSEGFATLWLGVWKLNFRAQAFYKKYGFVIVGEHFFHVGSDQQIDLVMSRPVT